MSALDDLMLLLKSHPGYVYITTDGTRLFTLVGPEQKLMCATCLTKNFHDMTDDEIEKFILKFLD